jgi:hypothetical protein
MGRGVNWSRITGRNRQGVEDIKGATPVAEPPTLLTSEVARATEVATSLALRWLIGFPRATNEQSKSNTSSIGA